MKTDCIMRIKLLPILGTLCGFIWLGTRMAGAWDYEGHHIINRLALASLPADFPSFALAPSQRERIAFLAGEPDRWRNSDESALRHVNSPDHYIDLEELALYGLTPETLPPLRYDFVARLALCRAAHPEKFPQIDPDKNRDHTRQLVGFLPWTITEYYAKLKSEFSYLKAFQEAGGTPEEIAKRTSFTPWVRWAISLETPRSRCIPLFISMGGPVRTRVIIQRTGLSTPGLTAVISRKSTWRAISMKCGSVFARRASWRRTIILCNPKRCFKRWWLSSGNRTSWWSRYTNWKRTTSYPAMIRWECKASHLLKDNF